MAGLSFKKIACWICSVGLLLVVRSLPHQRNREWKGKPISQMTRAELENKTQIYGGCGAFAWARESKAKGSNFRLLILI